MPQDLDKHQPMPLRITNCLIWDAILINEHEDFTI